MKRLLATSCMFVTLTVAVGAVAATHDKGGDTVAPANQVAAPTDQSATSHGSVRIDGQTIDYTATAGTLVLRNKDRQPIATMSYVAYAKNGVKDPAERPITFVYNGGPGSATMWLHMLAFGPRRVVIGNAVAGTPAPFQMVNNDESLLDASDLVFIDAPGTGFGRVIDKDHGGVGTAKDVYGYDEDAEAFAQFITRYLTLNSRWNSPKLLFGESYGTTRSAILANILESDDSVRLNGVVLLSTVLDRPISVNDPKLNPGTNLPYVLGLPSYTATAWYHHKLPQQPDDLQALLKEVEQFAATDYASALYQGAELPAATRQQIAEKLHQYTGLPTAYILTADLRIAGNEFAQELLHGEGMVTGRLDSRYSGPALDALARASSYDPMNASIGAPTVAEFDGYMRNTLGFGKGMIYNTHLNVSGMWDYTHRQPGRRQATGTSNVMPDLASAMQHNPNLKILVMGGYFDLATPFYTAQYEMRQLPMQAFLQKNISYRFFPSGHMVYLDPASHKGLHDASAAFIRANYKK